MQEFTYNVKCVIEYDGSQYYGFQHQNGYESIEDELLKAISYITKEDNKIIGSGRTDKGVHAKGQVINFYTNFKDDEDHFMYVINRLLKEDIRVLSLEYVDLDFHARFSAISKEYRYFIKFENFHVFDTKYYHYVKNLDLDLMKEAMEKFLGKHNFEGFCSAEVDKRKNFEKTITKSMIIKHNDYFEFIFEGTGFLKYQIRRMMSYVIAIGLKKEKLETIDKVFLSKNHQMHHKMAPGCGLYLYKVNY